MVHVAFAAISCFSMERKKRWHEKTAQFTKKSRMTEVSQCINKYMKFYEGGGGQFSKDLDLERIPSHPLQSHKGHLLIMLSTSSLKI